nr:MAG TPA: hypothetical protein [Caudoviricetes sp.]
MIENNVIINFASNRNVRELSELLDDVLKALGLSLLNREVVKLRTQLAPNEYQLIINIVLTEVQERAIQELFRNRKYKIFFSEFDNL